MAECPECGEESPDRFKFCGVCGSPLGELPAARREVRKTVTVVFCDVVGSTPLGERLDPESLRQVMGRYFEVARVALIRHGGTVEKFIGDAVMAVFGIPVLHEDDALRAVRAADDLRSALGPLNEELQRHWGVELSVRIGVNTGPVVAGDPATGQALVTGDPVNVAARLEQRAAAGEILIGADTWVLVRDAIEAERVATLPLKGKSTTVDAYRLLAVRAGAPGRVRRLEAPLVGRTRERSLLRQAYDRATVERACHLFTVLGSAGVGKSRLIHEFVSEIGDEALVLSGRCLQYGDGITFWPVAEILRAAAGRHDLEDVATLRVELERLVADEPQGPLIADRVAALLGVSDAAAPVEEFPWAVRKLLEHLAQKRPLVVVLDDLHWAEPTLLDLVEHVADWSRDAPILLLAVARADLLDQRPSWAGGKLNATSILLEPLGEADCAVLIGNLLGEGADDDVVGHRIACAAEGNPLFIEELVAILVEDGVLVQRDGRWVTTTDLSAIPIPPTISALLAARLDRLGPPERSVIERASVVGKIFYRNAVAQLSPPQRRDTVEASLMALIRKELIRPDRSALSGDDAFRFRHLLIRDAAYDALPRSERADLHERFATWLEATARGVIPQFHEIVGYHLEQACRQRTELAPQDPAGRGLGHRASAHLAHAGRRALARADLPAATGLLERAHRLAPAEEQPLLAAELAQGLIHAGRLNEAAAVLDRFERTEGKAAERGATELQLSRLELRSWTSPPGWLTQAQSEIERLLPRLAAAGEDRNAARALRLLGTVHWLQGRVGQAEEVITRALAHARRSGDARQTSLALAEQTLCIVLGPTPVSEGMRRCEDMIAAAGDDRRLRSSVLDALAGLHALQGRMQECDRLLDESTAILQDLGLQTGLAITSLIRAQAALYNGDPLAAEAGARRSYEALEPIGERSWLSNAAAILGRALHLQGLTHEAARFATVAESLAVEEDVTAQLQWRTARACVLAGQRQLDGAEALAREAVRRATSTDLLFFHGDAQLDLAAILRQQSRFEEARASAQQARALYAQKGATLLEGHASQVLEELNDLLAVRS